MANYLTFLGDKQILLEAPASGGLSKSESEVKADPRKAIMNVLETVRTLVTYMGEDIGPAVRASGASFEMSFAVRADLAGLVMVSEDAKKGQFQCVVRWMPQAPPRPAGPPGSAPPGAPPRLPGPT